MAGCSSLDDCSYEVLERICGFLTVCDALNISKTCVALRKRLYPDFFKHCRGYFQRSNDLFLEATTDMLGGGRFGHAMAFHPESKRIYIYGGISQNKAILNDLRSWGIDVYRPVSFRTTQEAMAFPVMGAYKENLIIFGAGRESVDAMVRFYIVNVVQKAWSVQYSDVDASNVAGSAIAQHGKFLYIFGGARQREGSTNQLLVYNCETSEVVKHNVESIFPRIFAMMSVLEEGKLLIVGGRSGINPPYVVFYDAYMVTLPKAPTENVEDKSIWPANTFSYCTAKQNSLIVMSPPVNFELIKVRSQTIRRLLETGIPKKRLKDCVAQGATQYPWLNCMASQGYRPDRNWCSDVFSRRREDIFKEYENQVPEISRIVEDAWRSAVSRYETVRKISVADLHNAINLVCKRHVPPCTNVERMLNRCFAANSCFWEGVKALYGPEPTSLIAKIVDTVHKVFSAGRPGNYMPMLMTPDDYGSSESRAQPGPCEVPIGDVVELLSMMPVHRFIFDVASSTTLFSVDLKAVKRQGKLRWRQQPPSFSVYLYRRYAPVVWTDFELFTCGGFTTVRRQGEDVTWNYEELDCVVRKDSRIAR